VFPFRHFINVSQGRAAEAFFWRTAAKKDRKVVQNLLFPTTRHHVVMNRMTPVELPMDNVFDARSNELFRGNLDCARLRALIAEQGADSIGYVYIEAENNASGGYPVSMANVREIRAIVAPHGIPMVLDATRLVENAVLIQRFEAGFSNTPLREIVREFCSGFDSMTCSLAKDFGITRGGLIATNDEKLFYRAQDTVATFGPGVNAYDKAVINAALKGWDFIEQAVNRRVDQLARLHAALVRQGLPVAAPASGHCLLFDVADYLDLKHYRNPVTAFVAWIFAQTGIRGGMHVTGMMKEFARPTLVRYAVPLCTPDAKIDALTEPFAAALKGMGRIPDLEKTYSMPGIAGQMHALYRPACEPA
jgi:tryptophanase